MDKLMGFAKGAASGSKTSGTTAQPAGQQAHGDYGDKAFDALAKKFNHGQPLDQKTSEKATDAGRALYEKVTGNKVNPKFSN